MVMEETNTLITLERGLPKYDGRDRSVVPSWKAKLNFNLIVSAPRSSRFYWAGSARTCLNPSGDDDPVENSADNIHTIER